MASLENIHTTYIIQTEQAILMHLEISTSIYKHMSKCNNLGRARKGIWEDLEGGNRRVKGLS